jgi:hypothetical protein
MADTPMRSATVWNGALQAAATVVAHLKGDALWGGTPTEQDLAASRRIVQLAAHIILEMPDDQESGVSQAKTAAKQLLKKPPA